MSESVLRKFLKSINKKKDTRSSMLEKANDTLALFAEVISKHFLDDLALFAWNEPKN